MTARAAILCLISSLSATAGWAQTSDARSSQIWRCFEPEVDNYANCIVKTYIAHDAELSNMYQAVLLSSQSKEATGWEAQLRAGQDAWAVFRDAACLAEAGEPRPLPDINLEHFFCLDRQTLRRIDDLRLIIFAY